MSDKMLLYISGSYPKNQEGIASGAKVLLDAMVNIVGNDTILLLTTDTPIISESINDTSPVEYILMNNWKLNRANIHAIYEILDSNPVSVIHMEYPGDLYGKTFLASFIPYIVCRYNKMKHKDITVNVRLHEFTRARLLRKIAILPILLFASNVYVPAKKDRDVVRKFCKNRVRETTIGTNIKVIPFLRNKESDKITISYFGSVYPGKGIEKMLSLWKKIKVKDNDQRFQFRIIGEIGTEENNHFKEYHEKVWELIDKLEMRQAIDVTGFIPDEEVSKFISETDIATLFYEDGLTLRRGSFLAYLAHGIPIVTSEGDQEAIGLFSNKRGIKMTATDSDAEEAVRELSGLSKEELKQVQNEDFELIKKFDWNNIAKNFLQEYGILTENV